ncbi:CD209 antigen-like protein B [Gambusia affinis]|uniref:CD209 antigen-like protein B n=1 Tax=Gambusia affinis TaxID=33528 RepID=UPI001CDB7741|nr:CD209 antigen-like protein B [Gambusia affinis]
MSYEDSIVHLLTYLRTDFRSPRSGTYRTSEPEHGPRKKSAPVTEFQRILKPIWHLVSIGVLSGILIVVVLVVIIEWNNKQNMITSIEQVKVEMKNNTEKLLEEKTRISEQLNVTNTNYSILMAEYDRLIERIPCNLTLLEREIERLNGVLSNALKAAEVSDRKVKQLTAQLNSTQNKYQVKEMENKKQRSFLSIRQLEFIWKLCNRITLECSRCLPGWTEHASRCFRLFEEEKKWEEARLDCFKHNGDLAVIQNAADQALLTNMTAEYAKLKRAEAAKLNLTSKFHSAWIGLQDMVTEGTYFWVNGDRIKWDVEYWRQGEPNNAVANWDVEKAGQDCVGILPPDKVGTKDWLNSWDDITCVGRRNYICETDGLILT